MSKLCCPVTGAYLPRLIICVLAGFAFIFGFDYLVHHKLLMETYQQTPDLWRTPETMKDFFPLMLGYQALLVLITAVIFTRNFEEKGIGEGIRFGIMIGALLALLNAAAYIWMPISKELALSWAGSGLGTGLGLGIIFSLLYKKG